VRLAFEVFAAAVNLFLLKHPQSLNAHFTFSISAQNYNLETAAKISSYRTFISVTRS
jgi:hypothetical protein